MCVHRKTREKCAVKIVDTSRLNTDDARHLEDEIDILKVCVCVCVVVGFGFCVCVCVCVGFLLLSCSGCGGWEGWVGCVDVWARRSVGCPTHAHVDIHTHTSKTKTHTLVSHKQ